MLETLFGEERRRTKVISHALGERAVVNGKLTNAALIGATQTSRRVVIGEFEFKQLVTTVLRDSNLKKSQDAAP